MVFNFPWKVFNSPQKVFNFLRKVLIIRGRFLILREHRKKSDVSNHFLCLIYRFKYLVVALLSLDFQLKIVK